MSEEQLHKLIGELRNHTSLGRIALCEVEAIFAKIAELGYVIQASAEAVRAS